MIPAGPTLPGALVRSRYFISLPGFITNGVLTSTHTAPQSGCAADGTTPSETLSRYASGSNPGSTFTVGGDPEHLVGSFQEADTSANLGDSAVVSWDLRWVHDSP
jgi:hypothetical protein